ncbi:MAG: helicase [Candidatus Hydrogenedentes bacterium]|nr:helicase [Candidatus Hydrogenedentota bacterium]
MPKLDAVTLKIKTGTQGPGEMPQYIINGFKLDFEQLEGGTGPGETLVAVGEPQSFPHSLHLTGPKSGSWEIEGIEATYECAGFEPYTVRLGAVTLDDESDLNIWHERPAKLIDV